MLLMYASPVAATNETLTVGMECNYAPFNWTQTNKTEFSEPLPDGQSYCDGYDVQIARIIADQLGMDLKIKNFSVFSSLVESTKNGDIDLVIAGMTDTPERRESIAFTDIYYKSEMVLVVRTDSGLAEAQSIKDFSGRSVAAQIGTMHDTLIEQIPGVTHSMPMESFPLLTTALKSLAIEAFVAEKPVAQAITDSNSELTFVEFAEGQGFEVSAEDVTVSIGVAKGNTELLEKVNGVLNSLTDEDRDQIMLEAIQRQPSASTSGQELMPSGFIAGVGFLLQNYWPMFLNGLGTTLLIALCGTFFGLIIGLVIAGLRQIKVNSRDRSIVKFIKKINTIVTTCYVQYLRGTPMMVQGILFYYGIRATGFEISPLISGIIVISVNTSAYMSEVIRAGIQSIDPGQNEAARSLGMSEIQTLRYIILPQALRNAIPAIGNEFVVNIKDSSVLNVILVAELFFQGNRISGIYYRQMESFFIISLIYLTLTLISTKILAYIEERLDHPKGNYPASQTAKVHFDSLKGDEK
ncbi:ABC transporter substrate-binding protein/permease [Erysipelothrix sp. HDW6C]|nr:ABC transporter substrate-binding protein/permease [Erysipelothrix sp. HDW6C]